MSAAAGETQGPAADRAPSSPTQSPTSQIREGKTGMSNTVKLSSKLAGDDDLNGLDSLAAAMVENPGQIRLGVVWFDCSKIVDNTDDETRVPYARIRRFEPVGNADEMPEGLRALVERAAEERTGKAPLPYNQVEGFEVEE